MAADFRHRVGVDPAIRDLRLGVDAPGRLHVLRLVAAARLQVSSPASAAGFREEDVAPVPKLVGPLAQLSGDEG
jgi:3-hydroxyisobutyrate dehydrogenase-like beta-hydroxyacid dehydrogenase